MRVILAGGGTAGHINPALAIADTVKSRDKNSEILFVGTKKGLESSLVTKKGYNIKYIDIQGLKGHFTIHNMVTLAKYISSVEKAKRIIHSFGADVVVGTGGYVCAPVVAAANSMHIPTLIHEQNVFPGNAIKMLSKKSSVTAISFAESEKYLDGAKEILLTGNPLRPEILVADREKSRETLGLKSEKLIVIFGGSLGAKTINDVACQYIERCSDAKDVKICLATGKYGYEDVKERIGNKYPNVEIKQYIHNMDTLLSAADVAVCRSGAITVSEISALGVPAVLVPSPNVTRNHQEYNARALSDNGAAITILEKDFNFETLKNAIDSLIYNGNLSEDMRKKAKSLAMLKADDIIYDKMVHLTKA